MVRRIDTLKKLRRERNFAQKRLDAALAKHALTLSGLRRLGEYDEMLQGDAFNDGLIVAVKRIEDGIDRYGDEWAKDDWPHAIPRGRTRSVRNEVPTPITSGDPLRLQAVIVS